MSNELRGVILICGKMGSGKSTISELLKERLQDRKLEVSYMPLASPLKKAATMLGWNGEKDQKGRRMLQHIGDVVREYDRDMFCALLSGTAPKDKLILCDDTRYENEIKYFKKLCPTVSIYISRSGVVLKPGAHASEKLNPLACDFAVSNSANDLGVAAVEAILSHKTFNKFLEAAKGKPNAKPKSGK